jgi:hypothetical protein
MKVSTRAIDGVVIVHGSAHLDAVFAVAGEDDAPITALTAPWVAAAYGPLALAEALEQARAAHPAAPVTVVLDCVDDAGLALAALRVGWRHIAFSGAAAVRAKLADIAEQAGARVVAPAGQGALDLAATDDPRAALRTRRDAARRRCK